MTTLRTTVGHGRLALRAAVAAAAFAVLVPASGWAQPTSTLPPDSAVGSHKNDKDKKTTVQVVNSNWLDVHVYLIRDGEPFSLGTVMGPGKTKLTMPGLATIPGSQVQILVLPIGGSDDFLSQPLTVNPGDVINLEVENSLPLSSVTVDAGS